MTTDSDTAPDMPADVLVSGTGAFAGRILLDLAATTEAPLRVVIAGRNRDRLDWLRTAANARAAMFGRPVTVRSLRADLLEPGAAERMIRATRPRVAVQAASVQTSSVISDSGNAWTALVAEGGLSATAVFQALLSVRVAAAIGAHSPGTAFINCAFPDVVNGMIAGLGHRVLCGTGNVAILSNVFAGALEAAGLDPAGGPLRVLAHYQNLAPWRRPAAERAGAAAARVFLGAREIGDVFDTFRAVRLTPEPAIEISGASGVTLIAALAAGREWRGHAPGPEGRPGGYPLRLDAGGALHLDLPEGVSEAGAVAWNAAYEERGGLTVEGGQARHHGALRAALARHGFAHADGFALADLEHVAQDYAALRDRLLAVPQ